MWRVLLLLLGGCFVEATAGVARWESHVYGGRCVDCGETWISNANSYDVGLSVGVAVEEGDIAGALGVGARHDRGRILRRITARADVSIAPVSPTWNARGTAAVALQRPEDPDASHADFIAGTDVFLGGTLATSHDDLALSLGLRRAERDNTGRLDDARTVDETRTGAELRVMVRLGETARGWWKR